MVETLKARKFSVISSSHGRHANHQKRRQSDLFFATFDWAVLPSCRKVAQTNNPPAELFLASNWAPFSMPLEKSTPRTTSLGLFMKPTFPRKVPHPHPIAHSAKHADVVSPRLTRNVFGEEL
jgi:hypothetical protein